MEASQQDHINACPRLALEIDVINHSGVMSHVVGLFSRRQFNVEAVLCLPVGQGRMSRVWLLVGEDSRLPQMIGQLQRLQDVVAVRRHAAGAVAFQRVKDLFQVQPIDGEAAIA
jgi:acetolactate synthase I/III small subunit